MSIVLRELQDIKNHCESQIPGSTLITCVQSMVRVTIMKTKYKQLTACIQFSENYPSYPLLLELKSKTLADKFLSGLTKVCENECRKILGKPQVLKVLTTLKQFLEENPLCVCSEEISVIKLMLSNNDELKIRQKSSSIVAAIFQELYYVKMRIIVPDSYPETQVQIELKDSNFPNNFQRWFLGQSIEIARQCVQKPLKSRPKDQPFQPKPSLKPALNFLIEEVKRYPMESCQLCKLKCFPNDPQEIINQENHEMHIERVYCGHIFHNHCLKTYMKTPPFAGGKKCPECKQCIFHEKWKVTPKLAEDRWAHHEAKKRELGEVVEFFE